MQELVVQAAGLLRDGRRTRALDTLDQALRLDRDNPVARSLRGVTLARMGRRKDAEPDLRLAVELAPDDARIHANLAVFLLQTGRPDEARTEAEEALRLSPDDEGAKGVLEALKNPRVARSMEGHTIRLLVGRERIWLGFGRVIVVAGILLTIGLFLHPPVTPPGPGGVVGLKDSVPKDDALSAFLLFGWIFMALSAFSWVLVDMIDRRSRMFWLVPQLTCGVFGAGWLPLALYLKIGRE